MMRGSVAEQQTPMVLVCSVPQPPPSCSGPAHRLPPLGGTSVELATTTYVALETVAGKEGCGGHMEPLLREGGRELAFQPPP